MWRSPTDVASSLSSSSSIGSTTAFVRDNNNIDNNDNNDDNDNELLKLGVEDSGVFFEVDVASAFSSVVASSSAAADDKKLALEEEEGFDQEMREFELLESSGSDDMDGSRRAAMKQEANYGAGRSRQDSKPIQQSSSQEQPQEPPMSTLELRRKRNRDSMRRARNRQRKEQEKLETMIDQLEDRLSELMQEKEHSVAVRHAAAGGVDTSYSYSAYTTLLRQTERLRDQNDHLSEQIRKHTHFQDRIDKLAEQDKKQHEAELQFQEDAMDKQVLTPLLAWMTSDKCIELVEYARDMLMSVADLTDSLAPTTYTMLGWEGKRTIHANWAHYTMSKNFRYESAEVLAKRTWDCTVNQDIGEMKRVLTWAQGTKVLHRLSDEAAIVARDMNIPNLQDIDHPIRIRYTLLVIRTPTPDGGFIVGTVTLNIYGTSVEECLEQKVSHKHGMNALTMYAFMFTRIHSSETGDDLGCNVRLAGRSGDGSLMYARKVLFEALPSILRWENTFVAPILRVTG